ncbi:MAG: bifunctional phosphoribosylaminoimidazolecarboxamide formyltransferase/IMP cyclohydrolase, partial [Burkholderiaceae bacterium]
MKKIINALISVYDKENLEVFARGLLEERINIMSTGGTAEILRKAGIATTKVEDVTNFPEILDGRVKTLNPRIHGGILAVRTNKKHIEVLERFKIPQVDLVVVNLYPFEKIREKSCGDENQIIEGIDIGGSSLIRAAAKNFQDVIVVVDPNDYQKILNQIKQKRIDLNFRRELAK